MNVAFLKKETFDLRTQETFVGDKCEIFLPLKFIGDYRDSNPLAIELGGKVSTIGIFWFRIDNKEWYELQLPLKFEFEYSDKYKKKIRLGDKLPEAEYIVYVLHKGDAFVYDTRHKEDLEDLRTDYIDKMMEKANIPEYVSYNDSLGLFVKAMEAANFASVGISAVSIEFILSEIYRSKKNTSEPFRLSYNGNNPYAYKLVPLTKVNQLNSTFTGIIGQDIQNQLISGVVRTREHIPDKPSAIENIIKY